MIKITNLRSDITAQASENVLTIVVFRIDAIFFQEIPRKWRVSQHFLPFAMVMNVSDSQVIKRYIPKTYQWV